MKYTTNFKGDTIKDPMRQKTLEDIDIKFWISYSKDLEERIKKAKDFILDTNVVVAVDIEGNLHSSKDILFDILEGEAKR